MTATVARYEPKTTPEKWMRPTNGCRLSVLVSARAFETLGESLIRPSGAFYDRQARTSQMKWLRRATGRRYDAPGYDRDNALRAYAKVFPAGNAIRANDRPRVIKNNLEEGWFYSISGNTKHCRPGSPLRPFVNEVAHEIGIAPFPYDNGDVDVCEPMSPTGRGWVRVPWKDIKAFSSEFAWDMGRRVCIRFDTGYGTAANVMRRKKDKALAKYTATNVRLKTANTELKAGAASLATRLLECEKNCVPVADQISATRIEIAHRLHRFARDIQANS